MNESRILAAMGHLNVTEAEVDAMVASLSQRGKNYNTPEGRRIVLDQLIQQKLILLDATRNLLEREPEFKAQLAKVKDDLLVNYSVSKKHILMLIAGAYYYLFFSASGKYIFSSFFIKLR